MARISKGILGGFSGKVGTVIGSNWRGIDCMRAVSGKRKTALSDNQKAQQAKFSVMRIFLQTMTDLLVLGYKDHALKMTEANSALGYNLKNAITGNYPDLSIVYPEVLVTRGALPNAKTPAATAGPGGTVNFNWTDNSNIGKAKGDDKAILVAYCAALNQTAYAIAPARSAGTGNLSVPEFSGETVQTWISFITTNGKDISTSIFTGEVNVV
jgi:hypothetical protein